MNKDIRSPDKLEDSAALEQLMRAYLTHELTELAAVSDISVDLDSLLAATFENIGAYLPPRGRLLMAYQDGSLVGCVFLKQIRPDAAEIKRLFVTPAARGTGLGQALVDGVLAAAREMGMARVLLDTGLWDKAAHGLYLKLGFRDIAPYPESENDARLFQFLRFMELEL